MRIFLLALFLAAIVTASIPTPNPDQQKPTPQGQCTFRNLYTDYLKRSGIRFLKKRIFTIRQCRKEWRNHGSCCNINDVNKFARRQFRNVGSILAQANELVDRTLRNIKHYLLTFHVFVKSVKNKRWLINKLSTKRRRKMNLRQRRELKKSIFPQVSEIMKWLRAKGNDMVLNQRKCLIRLKKTRVNSVCYTCSARAHVFFEKDTIRMHEQTCRNIITYCSNSWFYLIEFLDKVNSIHATIRELEKKTGIRFTASVKGSPAKNILRWADRNNFRGNLLDCSDGVCDFEKAKNICNNFVSVTKPMYLVNSLIAVRSLMRKSQRSTNNIKNYKPRRVDGLVDFLKSSLNQNLHTQGRSLALKIPIRPVVKAVPPLVKSIAQDAISAAKSVATLSADAIGAVASQVSDANPLLCPGLRICIADKVVLTASQCGSTGVECTSPSVFFNFETI